MGFRDKVHQAIAAWRPPKGPLDTSVYVDIDAADRQEARDAGATNGTADEDRWLVRQAQRESFFARCRLACVIDESGEEMRVSPFAPDSLL